MSKYGGAVIHDSTPLCRNSIRTLLSYSHMHPSLLVSHLFRISQLPDACLVSAPAFLKSPFLYLHLHVRKILLLVHALLIGMFEIWMRIFMNF